MGRWGWRVGGGQAEPREKLRVSRSDSYSDDYRITPELSQSDTYKNAPPPPLRNHRGGHSAHGVHGCCSQDEGCCSGGDPCCSQDERYYAMGGQPSRVYGNGRRGRSASAEALRNRRGSMGGLEVVVVDEGRVDLRRQAPCTSCESCDTCGEAVTRIELRNHLFTSPMHTTELYDSPYAYNQPHSPVRGHDKSPTRSRSPQRRIGNSEGLMRKPGNRPLSTSRPDTIDEAGVRARPASRLPRSNSNVRRASISPSRMQRGSHNNNSRAPSVRRAVQGGRDSSSGRQAYRSSQHSSNGVESTATRLPAIGTSPVDTIDHNGDNNLYRKSVSPGRRVSPSAERPSGGRGPGSGGPGGGSGGGPGGGGGGGELEKVGGGGVSKQDSGKVSMTLTKRDLLSQMVSQTKQHRQQIRSLENELERLRSGDVLNKCEVSVAEVEWRPADVVGEGSFSTVYKGTYLGTEVAVKELKFKLSQDDKNYFRSEAALLQQLHHPRIVLMMGVCTGSARPFMLLEYLAGGTLYNLIHNTTLDKLDHAAYFVVAKDIAQGMNYLHRHDPQVLHLDLKSMNVLLDSYTRAKIADFGFSILRRSRSNSPAQRGSIRGTPAWMAPELLTKGEVSAKCDVYSYAIILWEMLTSSHPFKGLDIFQIMERTESGGRPTLPVSRMSRELKELITSCWAQNPSLRPSFEEILGALETAAVPSSWRGLLQKANIKPAQLSDVTAARTIISVVEQSVELVRRSLQQQRASKIREISERNQDEGDLQTNIYETLETEGAMVDIKQSSRNARGVSPSRGSPERHSSPFRRSSPTRQPFPRDSQQGRSRYNKSQMREPSPQKEAVRRTSGRVYRPSQDDNNRRAYNRDMRNHQSIDQGIRLDRSRQRKKESQVEDAGRYRSNRHSPDKARENERLRNMKERKEQIRKAEISKNRNKAAREREQYEAQKNWEFEKNQFNRGKKEPKQIIDRRTGNDKGKSKKKKRSKSLESTLKYTDFHTEMRDHERHFSGGSDRHSDPVRDRNYQKRYSRDRNRSDDHRGSENGHRRNYDRLADSRDSLGDSQNESWTSIEGSNSGDSNNPSEEFEDHFSEKTKRRYSPSPRRITPEKHYSPSHRRQGQVQPERQHSPAYKYSPERRRSPRSPARRRAESGSRFGPLVVTSEQLLNQKQRLRPVRPSELSDLSQMPENSLNDISLILKTAITKRRSAFDEGMSGRDSFRSEFEWSDWH